jgi:selenocysteine-specific elongation factor
MDVIVGTAGHIDHGKTALVKALTGTDTDRLPEEKKRGITIDLGFAELEHNGVHFGFVDVPGHERFVKNMLAGASGIDLVMLVIAADEGVMPQTREHFQICRLLGVQAGIVVLTKSDLVDAEMIALVKEEAAELVAGSFLESADVVSVSARTGEGLDNLRDLLAAAAGTVKEREQGLIARLPVDRVFTKKGFGTVITGTLASGSLDDGAELDLIPKDRTVRVRKIQTHGRTVEKATAGNRTAVNLAGIDHDEVARGMLLAEKGVLLPTQAFDAVAEVLKSAERPLRSRQRVRVHVGSAEVLARVSILNELGEIAPGGSGFAQFRLESPVAVIFGERFVVRSYSPQTTIAGGKVLDVLPEKHRRKDLVGVEQFLDQLSGSEGNKNLLLFSLVKSRESKGIERAEIRGRTGWTEEILRSTVDASRQKIMAADNSLVALDDLNVLKSMIADRIEAFHKREPLAAGIRLETLRKSLPTTAAPPVMDLAITELMSEGRIEIDGDVVRLANRTQKLSPEESKTRDRLLSVYRSAKLEPQKLNDVLAGDSSLDQAKARQVFQMLIDSGDVVKVTDEYYFSGEALKELRAKVSGFGKSSSDHTIDVAQFKELAGVSRKYAIPLLEYFDREKVTVRSGDKRVIVK